jgi:hypothetical protein
MAQTLSMKGVITNKKGEVLIGVSVLERGTANATVSGWQ